MIPKPESLPKINRFKRGKGLVIVNTGNGKGKTTAALGIALRAAGYGLKVLIFQFVKGSWLYGELESLKKLSPQIEIIRAVEGFVGIVDDKLPRAVHEKAAQTALENVSQRVTSGVYDVVILDEILGAIAGNLLKAEEVVMMIKGKPDYLDLVLTGRNAPQEIIDLADTVTEMVEIKHPFQKGIYAKRGIDY